VRTGNRHGVKPATCRWINFMLQSRNLVTTLYGEILEVAARRRSSVTRGVEFGRE
jgi:hypothetical protein